MNDITVVLVTSVLPSHPNTSIIDETLSTIRHHLPDSEVIMQIDGLRQEQLDRKDDYDRYKDEILYRCLHTYSNVVPFVFDEHMHQSGMLRETINEIKTPLMLYVEGDAPLTPDNPIDWQKCVSYIKDGHANTIRFHHEKVLPREHEGLMSGGAVDGFRKTYQWSQRPHLSTVRYYKDVVMPTLPEKNFIEDTFHGIVHNDWISDAMIGWYRHRLVVYWPNNKNIQRSYHTDGRAGTRKFTSDDEAWGLV